MMSLRKSWVNVPLLKLIVKNNLLPAKISLSIFAGIFALTVLVGSNNDIGVVNLFIFGLSAIVLTIIYPCYLQSYLIDKTKSALMTSLPLTTKSIWFTTYLVGYLLALVTLLIEGFLLIVRIKIFRLQNFNQPWVLMRFLLAIIILLFIYYTITFFVCCLSGRRLGQVLFSLMIYCLPLVLLTGFVYITPKLVPYGESGFNSVYLTMFIPLAAGIDFIQSGNNYLFYHLIVVIGLFVASFYVYKNRENEYVGEPLVFHQITLLLKLVLIITITIFAFCLMMLKLKIDINYGFSGVLLMLLIYLIIGMIATLTIEALFKNEHVYRNLCLYLPVLTLVFGFNYYLVNQRYINIYSSDDYDVSVKIDAFDDQSGCSISMEQDEAKKLMAYLDNYRSSIHYYNIGNDDIDLWFQTDDMSYELYVEKDVLINYFYQDGSDYFKRLFNYEALANQKYALIYLWDTTLYLNHDDLGQLLDIIGNIEVIPEMLVNKQVDEFYTNGTTYLAYLNDQALEFINSDKVQQQSPLVNEAVALLDNILLENNSSYNQRIAEVLENTARDQLSIFYVDSEVDHDGLLSFDDDQLLYQITYHVVTQNNQELTVPLIFIAQSNAGGNYVITAIEAGG